MTARFDPRALEQVADASARYDQEESGLGVRFEREVFAVADLAATAPAAGRTVDGEPDLRRWNVSRFPYSLLYALEPEGIVVVVVAHHKRAPGFWRDDSDR